MKNFLNISEISSKDLRSIIDEASLRKSNRDNLNKSSPDKDKPFEGKSMVMIFEKPSTRTRFSFETAMYQLGGKTIYANMSDMQLGRGETIDDTAKVISRYVDIAMLRTNKHSTLENFAKNASIPVINGLTDKSHPCQVLADLITVKEKIGDIENKSYVWFGPANNMLTSWIHAAQIIGFELRICSPKDYSVDNNLVSGFPNITTDLDPNDAAKDCDCIITDTWFSMGEDDNDQKRKILEPYKVDAKKISMASSDAIFLHCLPAHRGEEVDADVIDGVNSVVWDEAENRVHAQKSIIRWCLS